MFLKTESTFLVSRKEIDRTHQQLPITVIMSYFQVDKWKIISYQNLNRNINNKLIGEK